MTVWNVLGYAVIAILTSIACRFGMLVLRRLVTLRAVTLVTPFLVIAMAATGKAAADPKHPQCWNCVARLTMELPAVNPQEDPAYEQGLTPGSVLPALSQCSLDDGELPRLQQVIKIFTDALVKGGGASYVREHLGQMPEVSSDDRAKLEDGAKQSLDTTLRHLVDHNCRMLVQSHFDEGASRAWIPTMIELGRSSEVR